MHCFGVTVLRVLNQKHHEERDDCRGGVDDQLPGVREMKSRSGDEPNKNYQNGAAKGPGAAKQEGRTLRERPEHVADSAKKIALLLAFLCFLDPGFVRHVT